MQKRKLISVLVSQAFATAAMVSATSPAGAQDAATERVVITGSAIKRVQAEGPAPVEVITKADITATGASTVNELMKSIASMDIYDQGELASNSPAGSGTANITMRGIDETGVLVLLNGRRLPVNAIYDGSGAGGAVDISMIPLSAIERVEILKDGGSAIYGADAVAGVVNFITKKNYTGAEVKGMYGTSSRHDGTEKQVSFAGGFGNLDENGYNFLVSYDNFQRDPIYRKDRDISRSADYRRFGFGDYRSSYSPYGNLLDENFSFTGQTVKPCPAGLYTNRCRYDFNSDLLTAYNAADRQAALVLGTMKFGSITGTLQFSHAESKDRFEAHPIPDIFVLPTGEYYGGRFMQGGPRISDRKSEMDYLNIGLEGNAGKFDWEVVAGYGRSRVTNRERNYFNADLWYPALESGAIDGTSTTNDQALVDSMKVTPIREGTSKLSFVDAKISGELAKLATGPLAYAVGTSFWREELTDTPDLLTQQGLVVGSIQQSAVNAARSAKALFGELAIPLPMQLEAQLAARYDSYPGASRTSPKAALLWRPSKALMVRGSYTESFKMPRLKQLYGAQEQGAITLDTDEQCAAVGLAPGCGRPGYEVQGGNKELKPEKGKTWNLGLVYDVGPLSGTVDWWKIRIDNLIDQPTVTQALLAGKFSYDSIGNLLVYTNLQNFAVQESEGIDIDARLRFPNVMGGTVTVKNTTTYYLDIKRKAAGGEWEYVLDTYHWPRVRNVLRVSYDTPAWSLTASHKLVGGFRDIDTFPTGTNPTPDDVRTVGKFEQVDISAAYKGFRNITLTGGIQNLMDRMPPISLQNASSNRYTQMGFAELYSSRGRFYYLTAEYKFK